MAIKKASKKPRKAKPAVRSRAKTKVSTRGKAKKTERRGKRLPDMIGDRFIILSSTGDFLTTEGKFNETDDLSRILFFKDKPAAKKHLNRLIGILEDVEEQKAGAGPFTKVDGDNVPEEILTAAVVAAKKVLATSFDVELSEAGEFSIRHGLAFKTDAVSFKEAARNMAAGLKEQATANMQAFKKMQAEHRRLEKDFEKQELVTIQKRLGTFNKKISMYA